MYGEKLSVEESDASQLLVPGPGIPASSERNSFRRDRPRALSNVAIPFLSTSPSLDGEKSPIQRVANLSLHQPSKAEHESRKLLGHILSQLERRRVAPSVWEPFVTEVVLQKQDGRFDFFRNGHASKPSIIKSQTSRLDTLEDENSDDEAESSSAAYSTDHTFALMVQLREVLWISKLQGWSIFVSRLVPANAVLPFPIQ